MTVCPLFELQFCNLSQEFSESIMAEGKMKCNGASLDGYCVLLGFEPRPDYEVGENAFADVDEV
ncbi:MAG: hypothetical protein V7L23_01595 [Nostoc sp.]|uniref:hypothetical protein n=1 Tax=Nostoc sp. TaxID=1180 RepID=UPI002FF119D0